MKIHTCAWSAPSEPAAITEFGLIEDPLDLPLLRPLISLGLREPPCPPAPAPCAVPPLEADAAAAAFCCALLILLDARTCRWRLTAMAPWMACMAPSHLITGYSFAFITRSIYKAILEDPISQSKCTVYAMGLACWRFSFVLPFARNWWSLELWGKKFAIPILRYCCVLTHSLYNTAVPLESVAFLLVDNEIFCCCTAPRKLWIILLPCHVFFCYIPL